MSLPTRKRRAVLTTVSAALGLLIVFALNTRAQTPTPAPSPTTTAAVPQSSAPCTPPPACPTIAPHVFQVSVNLKQNDKTVPVARRPLYLSPCAFNLEKLPAQGRAPSRKSYYAGVKASPQLINWLEANNCDTVYCRELTREEVTCNTSDARCVPEFVQAYNEALSKLKGDQELARKWVTNYAPLATPQLRVGFHDEKMKWLAAAAAAVEKASGLAPGTLRSAVTDRQGIAYFYDLCPGAYYISNLAPAEIGGDRIIWETTAIKVEKSDTLEKIPVTLTNVAAKKKNYFVGRKIAETVSSSSRPAGNR
ncbi:MAG TPA: hypothetical protein VEV81_00655 [Pyrinomonadaceae bacterium]|nr:hypothetical protein [Pyrinomonadaceae bacterium]